MYGAGRCGLLVGNWMSGRRSRNKGANGERELAAILRRYGFEARRGARNGVAGRDGGEDIAHSLDGVWLEAKRAERLAIPAWLQQAEADCPDGRRPVVVFRRNREPWRVVLGLDFFLELAGGVDGSGVRVVPSEDS